MVYIGNIYVWKMWSSTSFWWRSRGVELLEDDGMQWCDMLVLCRLLRYWLVTTDAVATRLLFPFICEVRAKLVVFTKGGKSFRECSWHFFHASHRQVSTIEGAWTSARAKRCNFDVDENRYSPRRRFWTLTTSLVTSGGETQYAAPTGRWGVCNGDPVISW